MQQATLVLSPGSVREELLRLFDWPFEDASLRFLYRDGAEAPTGVHSVVPFPDAAVLVNPSG